MYEPLVGGVGDGLSRGAGKMTMVVMVMTEGGGKGEEENEGKDRKGQKCGHQEDDQFFGESFWIMGMEMVRGFYRLFMIHCSI